MKTTRIYWRSGLASLHKKALQIVKYRDTKGVYDAGLAEQRATPHFYAPVPQDRQLPIEEITCRAGQNLISPEDAVAPFGLKKDTEQEEIERIKAWMEFLQEAEAKQEVTGVQTSGLPG